MTAQAARGREGAEMDREGDTGLRRQRSTDTQRRGEDSQTAYSPLSAELGKSKDSSVTRPSL